MLVAEIVTLPFAAWRHAVVARYGLSTQTWGGWAVDLLKSYAVGAVIGAVALLGFYTVVRLAPRWWWAFGAAGAAALVVLLSFVLPVLVEPIFNRFTPMAQGPLRTELMALAARDGVPVRGRAGRRRVPAHQGGERVRLRVSGRPGGSSSTTPC